MSGTTEHAITFFTALTLLANLATAAVALAAAAAVRRDLTSSTGHPWTALRRAVPPHAAIVLACLAAMTAVAGSLYLAAVAGPVPCRLCLAQRGLMLVLAALLAVAAPCLPRYGRAVPSWVWRPGMFLAAAGAALAAYHVLAVRLPMSGAVAGEAVAGGAGPVGFVGLPYMSLSSFGLVFALLLLAQPEVTLDPDRGRSGARVPRSTRVPRLPRPALSLRQSRT